MPVRQEKYKTHHSYASLYNGQHGGNNYDYTVTVSNLEDILEQLEQSITSTKLEELKQLLNADFVHPEVIERTTESSRHNEVWQDSNYQPSSWGHVPSYALSDMHFRQGDHYTAHFNGFSVDRKLVSYQADTYFYEIHAVQPVLEVLVLNNRFKAIYDLACEKNNGSLDVILENMSEKSFVGADLSDLNLSNANFTASDLSGATLGIIDNADLTKTNLKTTNISKQQLYTAKTYLDAQLPEGFRPFWTDATITALDRKIIELRDAAKQYEKSNALAFNKANELAGILEQMLDDSDAKYNEAFQEQFLQTMRNYDKHFTHAPLIQAVVASMALFIVSLGVGYLAAWALRARDTGNKQLLFFNQTAIEEKMEEMDKIIGSTGIPVV